MKDYAPIVGLFGIAVMASPPPPTPPSVSMIKSSAPIQCAPGSSIGVTFGPEYLELRLPDMFFGDIGHGRTDESTVCEMDIEFAQWWYKYRVAIKEVTYSGRLNLTNGVQLYQLGAVADFHYIHLENSHPIVQPEVRNLSTAVMVSYTAQSSMHLWQRFCGAFSRNPGAISDRGELTIHTD